MFFNDAGWVKANDGTWSCGLLIPIGRVKADGEIFLGIPQQKLCKRNGGG